MQKFFRRSASAAIAPGALTLPSLALAHPEHGESVRHAASNFFEGLMHPLGGLDHLLMIIAVSAWAALLPPRGRVMVAASLAAFVGIGALLPVTGGAGLEAAIALTVIGAGVLLAVGRRWPIWATGALGAVFAMIHGFAHGAEGPGASGSYVAGLMLTTGALALAISFAAAHLQARHIWMRIVGSVSAALGAVALAG